MKSHLIRAMGEEILLQKNYLGGETIETIYFGGGTPSLLDAIDVEYLLETIAEVHTVRPDAEITLEANPDDLSDNKLKELKALGINRLSIGIQSFDDGVLRYLHRIHTADVAIGSVQRARNAGFANISLDLIYAIPGVTTEHWVGNIRRAIDLGPQHLSAYTLTIEQKTTFGKWLAKGKLEPVDETLAAAQQEVLMELLIGAGYTQYEISNFAIPGFESRHNCGYWKGEKYLGIGPSAHSYDQTTRQHNVANNHRYVRTLSERKVPAVQEVLKRSDRINEYILTSLRTDKGCNLDALKRDFDYDISILHREYIQRLEEHNLARHQPPHLRLTEAGRLLADKISSDLFLIE